MGPYSLNMTYDVVVSARGAMGRQMVNIKEPLLLIGKSSPCGGGSGILLTLYHNLCYTSRGALAGTRNSSMGPP